MVNLRFTFSNILIPELKERILIQNGNPMPVRKEEANNRKKKVKAKEKEIPLFYSHKIRLLSMNISDVIKKLTAPENF